MSQPVDIETFQKYTALWRFGVRDIKQTAVGVVRAVNKKQLEAKNGKETHSTYFPEMA
jgi:hypothetical protein